MKRRGKTGEIKDITPRQKDIESELEKSMDSTVVTDSYVPMGYGKYDEFGNVVVYNRMRDLTHELSASYGRPYKKLK